MAYCNNLPISKKLEWDIDGFFFFFFLGGGEGGERENVISPK